MREEKEVVKCNINSCNMAWSTVLPKHVSAWSCRSHLEHKHKEEWLQYDAWIQSGQITAPRSFTSSSISTSPSSSASTASICTVINSNDSMVMSPKRQRSKDPIVINGSTCTSDTVLKKNVIRATAMLLAIANLPLCIVSDPAFRDFMNCTRALRSSYV